MARPKNTPNAGLSPLALNLLGELFSEKSNLSLPAGVAGAVVEIRNWVNTQRSGPQLVVNEPVEE